MIITDTTQKESSSWDALRDEMRAELEQFHRERKEISLMLEQSHLEVNKLAQRNASITTHLQQINNQLETLPRADIRMAYEAALDAQQRLFFMRGQLEKLQSDQAHMERKEAFMEQVLSLLEGGAPKESRLRSPSTTVETLEMMIQAQEAERQHLSRQMHDGPAQALSNFILQTEIAMRLFELDQAKAREELSNLKTTATSAFQQVRDFIFDLRPMMLDDLGVIPTIKRYLEAFKDKHGLDVRLAVTGAEQRLEPYLEVMIFRAVQELVGNAAHHSQANHIKVQVDLSDASVRIDVEDNGRGFDTQSLEQEAGMGLKVIKDRVEMLGGYFELDSIAGQGTRVNFQVPAVKIDA
jgi:two-component system, NarL family, sensor histidine kinase DegS